MFPRRRRGLNGQLPRLVRQDARRLAQAVELPLEAEAEFLLRPQSERRGKMPHPAAGVELEDVGFPARGVADHIDAEQRDVRERRRVQRRVGALGAGDDLMVKVELASENGGNIRSRLLFGL